MKTRSPRRGRAGPEYRIRVSFRVPLDFAFAWCTDFTPEDAKLEGESYQRKVVQRTSRRVVLEDLEETKRGWLWSREVVTLHPPKRWSMEGYGSRAEDVTAEYVLSTLRDGRTQLELRWRRWPRPSAPKITKAKREAGALRAWKRFGAAMERDYKRGQRRRPK
jgi:hypothetical protein